ncbi:MAG: hypothetical protein O2800_04000 [Planctomycetota bacterium]|nr:hypothetical protein [Planctomycetota bacterium]
MSRIDYSHWKRAVAFMNPLVFICLSLICATPALGLDEIAPLPSRGAVPPIYSVKTECIQAPTLMDVDPTGVNGDRAEVVPIAGFDAHAFRLEVRKLKNRQFGQKQNDALRTDGLMQLREMSDWRGFQILHEELMKESDDVRLALLDHYRQHNEAGQAALAWVAVHDGDAAIRNEATTRIDRPAVNEVLAVLDGALRSRNHRIVNNAGILAGALTALPAIPLLIFAQMARDPVEQQGDLAWIAIGTQTTYVSNLIPVTGNGSGGFQPVIGTILEGVVLRVTDAVAYTYRGGVHNSLVAMTTLDSGQSTAGLGWDMTAWARWYNDEYVPFKQAQARAATADSNSASTQ